MIVTEKGAGGFVAGTLVHTDKGLVPIEKLRVGDRVLSQPEMKGEQAYKRVVNTFVHEDKEIWFMHYGHGHTKEETIIYGTANHPVWVDGKGWTSIDSLRPGNVILTEDGSVGGVANAQPVWATKEGYIGFRCWSFDTEYYGSLVDFSDGVVEIEPEGKNELLSDWGTGDGSILKRRVFNIEVEDFHTYYVGQPGIWVHNCNRAGVNFETLITGETPW